MATASRITLTSVPERFRDLPYKGQALFDHLAAAMEGMHFHPYARQQIPHTFDPLRRALQTCHGLTLQERWQDFEQRVWPQWLAGQDRPAGKWWTGAVRVAVAARLVQPSWDFLCTTYTATWMESLAPTDPWAMQIHRLKEALDALSWAKPAMRAAAFNAGLRLLLAHGYDRLEQITEHDLLSIPSAAELGSDTLDAALCALGIFSRTPKRAGSRHLRTERLSVEALVERSAIPEPFRQVTSLYLNTYAQRISAVYATLRGKLYAL